MQSFIEKKIVFSKKKYTRLKVSYIEMEADEFAANLLLPQDIPIDLQELNAEQLAMLYEVPLELMQIKIETICHRKEGGITRLS